MRLFIASTFPAAATGPLNTRLAAVRTRLPAAAWVSPATQHLTFAFLGEQPETLVDQIVPRLAERLRDVGPFEARLRGCGFFPNPRHARVGWVGVEPHTKFVEVAEIVRNVVRTEGVVLDRSEFRPHFTLMRIHDGWPPASVELFNRTLSDFASESFVVDTISLYSSKLNPSGAVHTLLHALPLA